MCIRVSPHLCEGVCINVCWEKYDTAFLIGFNSFLETELLFGLELSLISLGFTHWVRVSQPVKPGNVPRIVTRYL